MGPNPRDCSSPMLAEEIFFDFTREAIESVTMAAGEIYMTPCKSHVKPLCLSIVGINLYNVDRGPLDCCFVKLSKDLIIVEEIERWRWIYIELANPASLAKLASSIKSVIDARVEKRRRHFEQAGRGRVLFLRKPRPAFQQ